MRKRLMMSVVLLAPLRGWGATGLLVPAYFDPTTDSADWNAMTAAVSPQVPITAIMNPDSGPVSTVDAGYTAAISSLQAAGGKVVAYVHTTDGKRSITDVENDIATYESEYPNINGIFIDEMATSAGKLSSYYMPLYSYIKSVNANWEVIGNPGTSTIQGYLSPTPAAADVLVTFEDDTGYSSYTPSAWQSNFSAGSFGNIATDQPDVGTMQSDVSLSIADRAGSVYFTDLSGTNPYATLPSYWSAEVAAVRAVNVAPKATYISTGSGDFNMAGNWSSAIPNAIDAEADFLGAITANRTVYADTAVTVGKIVFNNTHSYVLAGAGSLTLQTSFGSASIDAQAGIQKITLPITVASSSIFSAETGATLIIDAPVTVNSGTTLSESGAGTVTFLSTITVQSGGSVALVAGASIQSLVLTPGASASLVRSTTNGNTAAEVGIISLSSTSKLDLNDNDLIVQNGDLSTIESQIEMGRGTIGGISSSVSAGDSTHLTTLGAIDNGSTNYSVFDGVAVTASDILIKYTRFGDTNLDGAVDASDYGRIDAGYSAGGSGWYNGDFNGDGVINGADYALIDNSYNAGNGVGSQALVARSTAEVASQVPEPGGLRLFGSLLAMGIRRRRR